MSQRDDAGVPITRDDVRGGYPELDGLRGLAALMVVTFHAHQHGSRSPVLPDLFDRLSSGVAIFFVLSGFLLYRPFVRARAAGTRPDLRSYTAHRVARIVPAYWLALLCLSLWPGLPGMYDGSWLAQFGFLQIYDPVWETEGLQPAWSLSSEVGFYLFLPLVAAALGWAALRRGRVFELVVLGGFAFASVAASVVADRAFRAPVDLSVFCTFYLFAGGMALAVVATGPRAIRLPRWSRPVLFSGAIGGLLVAAAVGGSSLGPAHPFFLVVAVPLVAAIVLSPVDGTPSVLGSRPARFLGDISYGVYLWHFPLVKEAARVGDASSPGLHLLTTWLITLVASMVLATLSWKLVEQPILRWVRERTRQPPQPVRGAASSVA